MMCIHYPCHGCCCNPCNCWCLPPRNRRWTDRQWAYPVIKPIYIPVRVRPVVQDFSLDL